MCFCFYILKIRKKSDLKFPNTRKKAEHAKSKENEKIYQNSEYTFMKKP